MQSNGVQQQAAVLVQDSVCAELPAGLLSWIKPV
jgi:hypothetical protein